MSQLSQLITVRANFRIFFICVLVYIVMTSKRCEVCLRWVVHVFIGISPLNLIELRKSPVEKLIFLLFTRHFNWFLYALRKGHSSRALHLSFAFIRVTQRRCDPPRSKVRRVSGIFVIVLKS